MSSHYLYKLNRFQATGLHLVASITLISFIFGWVKWIWYPQALFFAASGFDLMKILIVVDLILGPLIMFIIFNPKKKSLKFDVSAVLICQLLFLAYGLWSLYTVRPAYIAFVDNQFVLVRANDLENEDLKKASSVEFQQRPLFGPLIVGTERPSDKAEQDALMFASLENVGIESFPQYYVPFEQIQAKLPALSKPLEELEIDNDRKKNLEAIRATLQKSIKSVLFCSVKLKGPYLYAAINASNGAVLGFY